MSAIRQLKRSIKEREIGERGQDKTCAWSDELGTKDKRKQRARRQSVIAKASRKVNRA